MSAQSHRTEWAAMTSGDPRAGRYRRAEREWWAHHGLEPTERFIELESPPARVRVLEIGAGKPLLFVHGTAGSGSVWAPLVRELEGYRCLMLDRPGWGLSSPADFSKLEYKSVISDLLVRVLDGLGVDRVHAIGGSVGNLWVLRLAEAHPSRVDRLVLIGGGPLWSETEVPSIIRMLTPVWSQPMCGRSCGRAPRPSRFPARDSQGAKRALFTATPPVSGG